MKFASRIMNCELSPIRKFRPYMVAAQERGTKVYHLNIGQPDVETPQVFFDAVRKFDEKVLEYAPSYGVDEFVEAVRDYFEKLGVNIRKEDILATYGGSEALQILFSCILDEGDEVLVPEPYYPNYDTFIRMTGGKICPIPTSAEEGYRFATRERIEPLINENTRAILFANPGNPTGLVLTEEEMQTIVDIAAEHDLCIISDEVYRELAYGGRKATTMLTYTEAAENVVVVDSVSKRFSATGSRVGVLVSRNEQLIAHAMKICQGRLCTNTLDQVGAAALYRSLDEAYYEDLKAEYQCRRDAVVDGLSKIPGVKFSEPEGAFYLMVTLPVDDSEKLLYFLLQEFEDQGETMMYAPGRGFYATPGKGINEIRIAYVIAPEELSRAIELLGLGIQAYNAQEK